MPEPCLSHAYLPPPRRPTKISQYVYVYMDIYVCVYTVYSKFAISVALVILT